MNSILKEFDEKLRNILLATMESYHDKRKAFESGVASQGLCILAVDEAQKMITYSVKSSLEKVARGAVVEYDKELNLKEISDFLEYNRYGAWKGYFENDRKSALLKRGIEK